VGRTDDTCTAVATRFGVSAGAPTRCRPSTAPAPAANGTQVLRLGTLDPLFRATGFPWLGAEGLVGFPSG